MLGKTVRFGPEWHLLKMMFLSDRNKNVIFGISVKFPILLIPSLVCVAKFEDFYFFQEPESLLHVKSAASRVTGKT